MSAEAAPKTGGTSIKALLLASAIVVNCGVGALVYTRSYNGSRPGGAGAAQAGGDASSVRRGGGGGSQHQHKHLAAGARTPQRLIIGGAKRNQRLGAPPPPPSPLPRPGATIATSGARVGTKKQTVPLPSSARQAQLYGGKKVRHYVMSLDGVPGADERNRGRLQKFRDYWDQTCAHANIQFELCPGVVHPVGGVGVAMGFEGCFNKAMADNVDIGFFFEDDSVLFNKTFCDVSFQVSLFEAQPKDSLLLLLGGHHFKQVYKAMRHKRDLLRLLSSHRNHWYVPISYSCGLYGFGLGGKEMKKMRNQMRDDAKYGHDAKQSVAPDISIHFLARSHEQNVYTVSPLLIDHVKGSFSNTKTRKDKTAFRNDSWIGNPNVLL